MRSTLASLVRPAVFTLLLAAASTARADNPLLITGDISTSDPISIGFDGPNSPGPSTFYYDLFTISVDTAGMYQFDLQSLSPGLAPWIGVYDNNFSPVDYFSPAPLDLAANYPGDTLASLSINLTPGTYQALVASVDWIEDPAALDEGPYSLTIYGPPGSDIDLMPAPGAAALAGIAGVFIGRRRR